MKIEIVDIPKNTGRKSYKEICASLLASKLGKAVKVPLSTFNHTSNIHASLNVIRKFGRLHTHKEGDFIYLWLERWK